MIANTRLVTALRKAADRIEAPDSDYRWFGNDTCNCGILARECLGISADELYRLRRIGDWNGCWHEAVCPKTGETLPLVFVRLSEAGIEKDDIIEIEFLANEEVCRRVGIETFYSTTHKRRLGQPYHYNNAQKVAAYFRAQADILEEQLLAQQPPAPTVAQQHPCVHMYLGGACIYCCHVEQPTVKEGASV